jgi:hypothetical protein
MPTPDGAARRLEMATATRMQSFIIQLDENGNGDYADLSLPIVLTVSLNDSIFCWIWIIGFSFSGWVRLHSVSLSW